MKRNYSHITYAYHFFSEAIIVFLLMIPVMRYVYEWIPYGRYFVIVLIGCCLLFIPPEKIKSTFRIIITMPILIGLFLISGFPVVLSILFPILWIWRYINIIKSPILNRENTYVKITLFFAVIYVFLIQDMQIIFYTFGLFIILIFGYIYGHMMDINKKQRQQVTHKLFTYTTLIILGGALVIFFAYDAIKWATEKVWLVYSQILVWIGELGIRLMEKGGFEFPDLHIEENNTTIDGDMNHHVAERPVKESFMKGDMATYIYIVIAIIIMALIGWLMYRLIKRQQIRDVQVNPDIVSVADLSEDNPKKQSLFKRMMGRYGNKPHHIVRKMVYDLEHKAKKQEQGRLPSETINDWFDRVGFKADMSIYEKMRYGNEAVDDDDIEAFKKEMKKIEVQLSGKNKEDK